MNHRRMLVAAALTAATALTLPAAAGAATATVTGDTGQPVPLSTSAPTQIRNMSPVVTPAFSGTEKRYSMSITGPDGVSIAASGWDCINTSVTSGGDVKFLGNGTYTVSIATSTDELDSNCAKVGAAQKFTFTVSASTSVAAPAAVVLTRKPGTTDNIAYPFAVGVNPGADDIEVRYARGATLAPDGGITGDPSRMSVDTAAGTGSVTFYDPGTYTFVSRAVDYGTNAATAWSAPVTMKVLAPFDFSVKPAFIDSRGPRYSVSGYVREKSAAGKKITVSIAKGRKGGKFHRVGKVKVHSGGRFTVRFSLHRRGRYRMRYSFKTTRTVAGGTVTQGFKIKRVRF